MPENESHSVTKCMERVIFKGVALARSKLTAAMCSFRLDINDQFPGNEMIDSRQYRHTWVDETIEIASSSSSSMRHRAIRERISGGNLLIGCEWFLKDAASLNTPCAVASRLSTCRVHPNQPHRSTPLEGRTYF